MQYSERGLAISPISKMSCNFGTVLYLYEPLNDFQSLVITSKSSNFFCYQSTIRVKI